MNRKTLAQAKASDIPQAINIAACDPRFTSLLNEAQERLADMGKWWGTWRRLCISVAGGCITWPREVATVNAFAVCGSGVEILNSWYEFQDSVLGPDACWSSNAGFGPGKLLDRSPSPQFLDLCTPARIRIYPATSTDAGKRVLLQGYDENTNLIRTNDDGTYVDGEYVTLKTPFVTSVFTFMPTGLTAVEKPVTNGRLNVFALDPATSVETKIAIWEASETAPMYRRSYLAGVSASCCLSAEAIVRLQFIPALVDSDWLFISSIPAIKHMMKAIQREDRNQYVEAERETQLALRSLRNQEEKYSPQAGVRIGVRAHGYSQPARMFSCFS